MKDHRMGSYLVLVRDIREGENGELNRSSAKVGPEKGRDVCSSPHGGKPGHRGPLPRFLISIIFYPTPFLDLKDRVPLMGV